MKRQTIYKAWLKDGRIIKAKTRARIRKFAPNIIKVWMDTHQPYKHRKSVTTQWAIKSNLDRFLKR